ncbi:MAG: hypothetical protein IH870_01210 [Chloroflexi bacterium]|nr:hypothetical protein [Chloroflexota bacterium]
MPGKGRRIASRQAQVGRRRRRQLRGPSGVPEAGSGTAIAEQEEAVVDAGAVAEIATTAARVPRPAAPAAARSNMPIPARLRGDRPAATNYVKAEVIRILIMAGTLTAVLILISVFI